jgi:acyl transferase domain-containing protein/acyl-CoA synthetase (AMP-forming)/AMP-acid ligase II/acyl carrier protein/2-polyprenyl-3-methyl-5-hydroxy-6-metoxy-1,4-benzoquinol methylase
MNETAFPSGSTDNLDYKNLPMTIQPTTLVKILRLRAQNQPNKRAYTFLVDGKTDEISITYAQLDQQIRAIAAQLLNIAAPGERALLLYPAGLDFIKAFFGCLYAGIVAVPTYPPRRNRPDSRFQAIANDAQATVVLTITEILSDIKSRLTQMPEFQNLQGLTTDNFTTEIAEARQMPDIHGDTLAFLQYTSGSTGTPKGVMISHGNLLHNSNYIKQKTELTPNSVFVTWLPSFHDMGLMNGLIQPLYTGGVSILMSPLYFLQKPIRWLKAISHYQATYSGGPNFAYDLCVRKTTPEQRENLDLSHWCTAYNGAEPIRRETLEQFVQVFKPYGFQASSFYPCYGLAENTVGVSGGDVKKESFYYAVDATVLEQGHVIEGTKELVGCGPAGLGTTLIIANPESREICGADQVGEIWVSGPSVAQGYWNKPEETKHTFQAYLANTGEGPFLRTGDLGFLKEGELFVTARLKDLIIIRGRNYYPQDIELTVEKSHKALNIGGCAAFSVEKDGEECLVIVQEVQRTSLRNLEVDEVTEAIRQAVLEEHELIIDAILLLKTGHLPKTSSGKVQRRACREKFLTGSLEVVGKWQSPKKSPKQMQTNLSFDSTEAETIQSWLVTKISQKIGLEPDEINTQHSFIHYGIDSLMAMELLGELSGWMKQPISPTLPYDYPTINTLARHLAKHHESDLKVQKSHRTEPIALIGMSCRFPQAKNPDEFWQLLKNGVDAISEVPKSRWEPTNIRWGGFINDVDLFDSLFFGISPREAESMDPQQRLLLEVGWEALENAGISAKSLAGSQTGVFVGISTHDYYSYLPSVGLDAYFGTGNAFSIAANRLSYLLDLHGPSKAIDTACSSSLVALHDACQSLRQGECDLALAGGVNLMLSPELTETFSAAQMLSPDGRCKTFDADANGYVRGEGCGIVVLKRLADAERDFDNILAVIKGSAVNQDGRSNGLTAPNGPAQQAVIRQALANAEVLAKEISYVEAHGTGTPLGDPIELNALKDVLMLERSSEQACYIGSVKTNIGHLEAAAGIAGLIKVVLALQHQEIPPHLHLKTLNPHLAIADTPLSIPKQLTPWSGKQKLAGVSSFGFGGTNAHIILEKYDFPLSPITASTLTQLMVLSAKNDERLKAYAQQIVNFLEKQPDMFLSDFAYTLQVGREAMEERLAMVVSSLEEVKNKLTQYAQGKAKIDNFYRGNVNIHSAQSELLIKGKAGKAFLKIVVEEQEFSQLAQLWVSGVEIDWQLLYPSQKPQRISLPTYPFAKERYWISTSDKNLKIVDVKGHKANLHPLLDSNESTLEEQCFKKVFFGEEFYLTDHQMGEQSILPAVVYLEMALAAGNLAQKKTSVKKLTNIVWASPITVSDQPVPVHISLYPDGQQVEFEVSTLLDNRDRQIHAQGKLNYGSQTVSETLDIFAIQKRCVETWEGAKCYQLFQTAGLNYGSSFQTIQALHRNDSEALSRLQLPKALTDDFVLHPSLIDGALQTVIGLIGQTTEQTLYLPFALGEVELLEPLSETCYAYVRCVEHSLTAALNIKKFNISILSETGQEQVRLKDFSVRAFLPKTDTAVTLYYQSVWEPSRLFDQMGSFTPTDTVLLFDTDDSRYSSFKECFKSEVILVMPGEDYQTLSSQIYSINPNHPADYHKLLAGLANLPSHIVHLWSQAPFVHDETVLNVQLEMSLFSIFHLSKAIIEQKPQKQIQLLYVYLETKETQQPQYAALSGFAKTIRLENPNLSYKTLALPSLDNIVEIVSVEFQASDGIEIRYNDKQRWVKRLQEVDGVPATQTTTTTRLKEKGVYLITGGAGGLGLIFAEYLAKHFKAKLVLTGRSELNEQQTNQIQRLNNFGAEVIYQSADISKRDEVKNLIAQTKSRFNEINGIIHSAGIIKDAFVLKKNVNEMAAVLAPKVYGTVWLDEATQNEPLDFFVLFSSITATFGNVGQCDYAYANSFMDNFALRRDSLRKQQKRFGKTLSINWPLWLEGGMRVDEESKAWLKQHLGLLPLSTETGLNAFETGLRLSYPQLMVVEGFAAKFKNVANAATLPKTEQIRPTKISEPELVQLQEQTEQYLKDILSQEIKLAASAIRAQEPLEKYGFDSVMVMSLTRQLEKNFGELSKTLLFEYQTLQELAGYFIQHHREQLIEKLGLRKAQTEPHDVKDIEATESVSLTTRSRFMTPQVTYQTDTVPEEIAIIGVSGRYPMAPDLATFWNNLTVGKDCITEIPIERWDYNSYYDPEKKAGKIYNKWGGFIDDVDKFDPLFFNISGTEAELMDPQERLFLETVWHTLEDAGYTKAHLWQKPVGVFVGVMWGEYQLFGAEESLKGHPVAPSSSYASIANRVSYYFNFTGPSFALDSMCSSSLTAIHIACESLKRGESELAFAGGVNVSIHSHKYLQLSQGGFASSDGRCRSFGEGGDGYVPGEGVGAVLLKPLNKAIADGDQIYAVIKGSSVNHGGKTNGYTVPNPNAQADLIATTLKKANIEPRTLSYVEAHGTGTSLGDPIEIRGLMKAYQTTERQYCPIGSVKSNIGHLESAAGIAGLTKVLLQLKYKQLAPSLHSERLNPNINFSETPFYVQRTNAEWKAPVITENGYEKRYPRRAAISSFGAGGANAHLILEEYNSPKADIVNKKSQLIVISAKNEERLHAYIQKIINFLNPMLDMTGNIEETVDKADLFRQIQQDLLKIASELLKVSDSDIDLDEDFSEYGFDTVSLTSLCQSLNDKYHVSITPTLLSEHPSLAAVTQYLCDHFQPQNQESATLKNRQTHFSLAELAYTLQVGREAMEERLAVVVSNLDEMKEKLTQYIQGQIEIKDFYRGNIKQNKTYDLLVDGKAGEAFLRIAMEEKELTKLAQLWISGIKIDWQLLYPEQKPQRISLPTYPFARERYWISITPQPASSLKIAGLHPLCDHIDPYLSLNQGVVFQKTFNKTDLILKDHQVRDKPILPGVGYLEMAYAAGSLVKKDTRFKLTRVIWRQPLAVLDDIKEVQIVIQEDKEQLTYQIQSREGIHATGEFQLASTPPEQRVTIEEIKARCSRTIKKETLYNRFQDNGIHYGAYFQGVSEVWGNTDEALSRLELPEAFEHELPHYTLHPTLMDGALQTIAGIGDNLNSLKGQPLLPFAIEEMEVLQPFTARMYAYVKASSPQRFQIALLDETGLVCLKCHDFSVRALPDPLDFFYVPRWISVPLENGKAELTTDHQTVLIVYPTVCLGLEKALTACHPNDEIQLIQLGITNQQLAENHWEINTKESLALERRIESLDRLHVIYYLGGIETESFDIDDLDALEQSQERGVLSLFRLIKTLSRYDLAQQPLQLNVITNDIFKITSIDITKPFAASLYGLSKAIAKEYPQLRVRCIDISFKDINNQDMLMALVSPILTEPDLKGKEVVFRDSKRYIRRLEAVKLPAVNKTSFKHQGVYLILGGAGGIGLSFSHYLAKTVQARLILLGRSELSTIQLDKLSQIESQGGKVLYLRADATDFESMQTAINKAKSHFGQINGVVHSAIVLRDQAIDNMDEDTFRAATAPKVQGSVVLHKVLKSEPLDFMMFFSSAQSFFGNAGQSNYAAGCTFKDAFAHALNQQYDYPVKIINWGYWGGVGIVATDEYRQRLAAAGIESIEPHEGMEAIERILNHRVTQVMPLKAKRQILERMGIDRQHQIELYPATMPSLFETLVSQIKRPSIEAEHLSQMEKAFSELTRFGQQLLLEAFQRMDVFQGSGEHYEPQKLTEQLNIIPAYARLSKALLEILQQAGFVRSTDTSLITTEALDNPELHHDLKSLEQKRHHLAETYPDIADHLRLLWVCLKAYPDILTGQTPATDIMFPHSSLELVEGIYKGNTSSDYFNQLVVQSVQSYIQARLPLTKPDEKIKILEVGAGTGGTSALVLESIDSYREQLSYRYTDISAGFTQYGKQHYGQRYPFIDFGILNVENSIKAQGYEFGDFDVIIAANVLHATRNIHQTVNNLKALLKTHGCLILNEVTRKQTFATLTFGLLEGWWLFEDVASRLQGSPLLSAKMWERLLEEEGFERVKSLGLPEQNEASPQHIIIAESNGEVKHQTVVPLHRETKAVKPIQSTERVTAQRTSDNLSPVTPVDVLNTSSSHQAQRTTQPIKKEVKQFIEDTMVKSAAKSLGIDINQIELERSFAEYGVDSIIGVELVNKINEALGITLRTTVLFDYANVMDLSDYIYNEYGSKISDSLVTKNSQPRLHNKTDETSPDTKNSSDNLELLQKIASGELSADEVITMMESATN